MKNPIVPAKIKRAMAPAIPALRRTLCFLIICPLNSVTVRIYRSCSPSGTSRTEASISLHFLASLSSSSFLSSRFKLTLAVCCSSTNCSMCCNSEIKAECARASSFSFASEVPQFRSALKSSSILEDSVRSY